MKIVIPISGAKGGGKAGGGGSGRVAVESPDTLRSIASARVLDLLCEGEIEGLVDGAKSIYLDGTPLQNADGTYNFTGITVDTRSGSQAQAHIEGFSDIESEKDVGVEITAANPVIRTITDINADRARITVGVPQLSSQDKTSGDISGTSVDLAIDVQSNGGGFTTILPNTITGKATTRYQRSYNIPLTGSAPWDLRLRRVTPDNSTSTLINKIFEDSYTEIINSKLTYPNSALVYLSIDSQQFRSIPTRGYDVKLKNDVQIPSNYDPITRTYTGAWDGTFQVAWTNNPAWCFYDLLVTPRYGLGNYVNEEQVDKWALYQIGKYCDEMVPDGFGGFEPRFTSNLYIQTRQEAFKVIQDFASVFRSVAYWASGAITAFQDCPADATAIFTPSNVIGGKFTYAGTSLTSRHTVVLVSWNDPADLYRQKIEYVEDAAAVAAYGIIETEIVAVGCTSRGQAHRIGKWLLYTEQNENETITFKSGEMSALVRPGQIMKVQDPNRAGLRLSGRVLASTINTVTLDQNISLNPGETYTITVALPNGSVIAKSVASAAGAIVTLNENFATQPLNGAVWLLSSASLAPQTFRVISMIEAGDGIYEISGLKHDPNKYARVEQDIILEPAKISTLSNSPDSPNNVVISEALYLTAGVVKNKITGSWDSSANATSYSISWKRDDGNYNLMPETNTPAFELPDAQPGLYTFRLISKSALGKPSVPTEKTQPIYGKITPPLDVQNFRLVGSSNKIADLAWDAAASQDLDVTYGGGVWIRFTPKLTDQDWNDGIDIKDEPGNSTGTHVQLQTGTYMAKFFDSSGNTSSNAAYVISNVADLDGLNVVANQVESPAFTGTKTDMIYDSLLGGLKLDSYLTIDQMMSNISTWPKVDSIGGVAEIGVYAFSLPDLGAVYPCKVSNLLDITAFDTNDTIDSRMSNIDSWNSIDGAVIDDVSCGLYIAITNDNPAGSPVYSDFVPFLSGEFTFRHAKCELRVQTQNNTHNLLVNNLSVKVDMPDRTEKGSATSSIAGPITVAYQYAFKAPADHVGITINNGSSGDYWDITNKTSSGFDILVRNAAGANVARNLNYSAPSYGKKVA